MKLLQYFSLIIVALLIGSCAQKSVYFQASVSEQKVKIAMILPEKRIGRYAHTTSTAAFAYFLTRGRPFVLKTFQIDDETPQAIEEALDAIKEQSIDYVIAPVTVQGARIIAEREQRLTLFFPTIHKDDIAAASNNIYFGAIDYRAQIEKLTPLATSPLVVMYDTSAKGKKLLNTTKESYLDNGRPFAASNRRQDALETKVPYRAELEAKEKNVIAYGIDKTQSSLKSYFDHNEKIQYGSFFLNTPLIKSTMILSQLSLYEIAVTNVLSTQINYDPLLLSMTQNKDRDKLYIANSITIQDDTLIQANTLLSNDISYDWINYASTVGADLFYHQITGEERIYDLPLVENQVVYPIAVVQPTRSHFNTIEPAE